MPRLECQQGIESHRIYEVLNAYFDARNGNGAPLGGWRRAVWPVGRPFLVNRNRQANEERQANEVTEAVVWFPVVTEDLEAVPNGDWLNVVMDNGNRITTTYRGARPLTEVEEQAGRYVGKFHIVFARYRENAENFVFLGIYSCTMVDHVRTFTRVADTIETTDWIRPER